MRKPCFMELEAELSHIAAIPVHVVLPDTGYLS